MLIKSTFGSNVVKDYGVIVMTYGDSFGLDMEEDGQSFQQWYKAQTGDIQKLFAECNNRCVLFNNRTDNKNEQRGQLFSFVSDIQSKVAAYKVDDYNKAVDSRNKILVANKLHKLAAETRAIMNDIEESLDDVCEEVLAALDRKTTLEDLLTKLFSQKTHLQKEDMGTQVLNQLFVKMSVTEMRIMTKIKLTEQRIHACESDWVFVSSEGMEYSYEQFTVMMDTSALLAGKVSNGIYTSENSGQDTDAVLRRGNSAILVEIRKADMKNDDKQTTGPCNQVCDTKQTDDLENIKFTFTNLDTVSSHKFKKTVFIFLNYGLHFTENERQHVILKIQSCHGFTTDKNKSILVLTYDHINILQVELGQTFEDWCQKQTGIYKDLLNVCENRCLLFNTSKKEEDSLKTQSDTPSAEMQKVAESTFFENVWKIGKVCAAKCLHYIGQSFMFDNNGGKITDIQLQTNMVTFGQGSQQGSNSDCSHVDDVTCDKQEKIEVLENNKTGRVVSGEEIMDDCVENYFKAK